MDIDEEFDALDLPKAKKSLAWDARAKITWGDPSEDVQTWLVEKGVDSFTAERIVAIAVHERATAVRAKGVRDFVLGILIAFGGAAVGMGGILIVKFALFTVPAKGVAVLVALAFGAMMYGVNLIWRGLARMIGGSRVKGAVSDVGD